MEMKKKRNVNSDIASVDMASFRFFAAALVSGAFVLGLLVGAFYY